MMLVVAPLLLSLTLTVGLEQAKPDFSGKWTKIPTSPGEGVETMTISQTADTLTVETQSPRGVMRWVQKLDGSESKNVIKPANAPEYVQVSTTTWDGDSLVTRTPVPDASEPHVLTTVTRLEGATLVIHVTQTIDATGPSGIHLQSDTQSSHLPSVSSPCSAACQSAPPVLQLSLRSPSRGSISSCRPRASCTPRAPCHEPASARHRLMRHTKQ